MKSIIRIKDFRSDIPPEYRNLIGDDQWVGFASAADVKISGKAFEAIDTPNKRITFVSSDDGIDRDEERIAAGAFHELIGNYKRAGSPVISSHIRRLCSGMSATAGFAVEMVTKSTPFVSVVQFIETAIGKDLWEAYRVGAQRGISVSFRAIDIEKENQIPVITKAELLEQSLVIIPANPRAVAMGVVRAEVGKAAMGSDDAGEIRELRAALAEMSKQLASVSAKQDSFTQIFGAGDDAGMIVSKDGAASRTLHLDADDQDDDAEAISEMMSCFST